jgi:bifunctional non-homologous end joining protein LigD
VSKRIETPGFIKPQLATLKSKAPKGGQWLHEIKYDGYRVQVHLNRGRKKVFTRTGLDWTKRFTEIAGALAIQGEAIIDGEVVVVHEGRTNFSELQAELAAGRQGRLIYYAFDLLWRNGDLRRLPQIERKQLLLDLLGENDIELPVLFSEHLVGDGQKMFEHATKLNWEGIISKRADAPYRSERTENWLKIKAIHKGKFPVVGFVKDPSGVAAPILARRKATNSFTWAKWVPAGLALFPARSEGSSIQWSVRSPSSPSPLRSLRPRGWSQHSLPILSTGTSRQRAF